MISKTGLYVIRALSALAKLPPDSWMGTAALAQEIEAPVNYLGKLLHILAREQVILSQKGVRGGVRLARSPEQITLYEALAPFENFGRWTDCLLGKPTCPDPEPCAINKKWAPARDQVLDFLRQTTAANLVEDEKEKTKNSL